MPTNKVVLGKETLIDLTSDTVTAGSLEKGKTAHTQNGEKITGTADILYTAVQTSLNVLRI